MGHKVKGRRRQSTDLGCLEPALPGPLTQAEPALGRCPRPHEGQAGSHSTDKEAEPRSGRDPGPPPSLRARARC